jgi:hypothetical protein
MQRTTKSALAGLIGPTTLSTKAAGCAIGDRGAATQVAVISNAITPHTMERPVFMPPSDHYPRDLANCPSSALTLPAH